MPSARHSTFHPSPSPSSHPCQLSRLWTRPRRSLPCTRPSCPARSGPKCSTSSGLRPSSESSSSAGRSASSSSPSPVSLDASSAPRRGRDRPLSQGGPSREEEVCASSSLWLLRWDGRVKQATADDYATLPTVEQIQAQLHVGKLFVSQDVSESEKITVGRLCAVWDEVLQKAFWKAISSPMLDLLGQCRLRGLDFWPPAVGTTDDGGLSVVVVLMAVPPTEFS